VKDLRWKNDVLPRDNYDWPKNGESLGTGKSAMVVMAGDQLGWIKGTYSDVDMSQFGFAPLPVGEDGKSVSLVGGNIAMVSSKATADQIEAAVYFRLWQQDGTWDRVHDALRTKARQSAGKTPKPTVAIVDSQSVKTTEQGGPRGADAGKKSRRPQAVRGG